MRQYLRTFFPFLRWFDDYGKPSAKADLVSGVTVALVLIPQSMAYAQLAGLPAYYGLYAAFLPPAVAALFGSSRQLATGPVAIVSLMTAATLAPLATSGSEAYIAYAILLAIMVGLFQLAIGVLRLGLIVNFLSHPVVNGFTNAAAIIIATSQLSKLFGVTVGTSEHHYETIRNVIRSAVHYTHFPTLAMGVAAFAIMYGLKKLWPRVPNVLVAVAVTTLVSWAIGFEHNTTIDAERIASSEVSDHIRAYNHATYEVDALAEQRAELNAELQAAQSSGSEMAVIQARHLVDLNETQYAEAELRAHSLREILRGYLFVRVEGADGSAAFYRRGDAPPGAQTDGRTWRLSVGNAALATDSLNIRGGGAVVGVIPRGLPAFGVPDLNVSLMLRLLPFAAIISLLGFMEAISIAKAMASKTGQRVDPNQELIGQGLANLIGALGRSYPASGSFSRSAVNLQAGAETGMSSVFTSATVVVVLLFMTPLLYYLPQSVLAAIIMMAVIGLLNVSGFVHAWRAKWYDGMISVLTFAATLYFAPHLDKGIMIGVGLSIGVFLYKSMRPHVARLSRTRQHALRSCETYGLRECRYIVAIRFDGPLFFANCGYLEDRITELVRNRREVRHILLVANAIHDIDASGEETLSLLVERLRSAGIDVSVSGLPEPVMHVFERTFLLEKIGRDHVFPTMEGALAHIHGDAHRDGEEATCPLLTCVEINEPDDDTEDAQMAERAPERPAMV